MSPAVSRPMACNQCGPTSGPSGSGAASSKAHSNPTFLLRLGLGLTLSARSYALGVEGRCFMGPRAKVASGVCRGQITATVPGRFRHSAITAIG